MAHSPMRETRKRQPSIADVARLAGVSAQTVSRVSTGSSAVRPATKEKVLAAMGQLGYTPNRAARVLRGGSFLSLGVVAQRLERTGEAGTVASIVAAAEARGYSVTLVQVSDPSTDGPSNALHRLAHAAIDGLIVVRIGHLTPEKLAFPSNLPVVVSDSRLQGFFPSVSVDQVQGTRDAIKHLISLGHRNVHHIAGNPDSVPAAIREAAWRRALAEEGISAPEPIEGDWTAESGYAAGKILANNPEVTAVYCGNDEMAFGLIRALHEAGRRVPEDVSVVGFDDIALSEFATPALTTVRQDFHRIGEELVARLVARINDSDSRPFDHVLCRCELVLRDTTGPPPDSSR